MRSIVCCSEISDPHWRWIEHQMPGAHFDFVGCSPKNRFEESFFFLNLARIRGCLEAVRLAKRMNADVLVAHGPTLAAWCGLFGRLLGLKSRLFALSFNFVKLPNKLKTRVFAVGLRQVDRFTVFSTVERKIYAKAFSLSIERFDFVHWGVHVPRTSDFLLPQSAHYVSAIGGNARDYPTLLEAARLTPEISYALVVRPASLDGLSIPPNVRVNINLPLDDTMALLSHSRFMVLPLNSPEVPCGHVTIVAAMHLERAMIVTGSSGIEDYVKDGESALMVPHADVAALTAAIRKLWNDRLVCEALAKNGKRFASVHCTEENIARQFDRQLSDLAGEHSGKVAESHRSST
jgi:glycosyltransferase involved in cell wall biosynthesis